MNIFKKNVLQRITKDNDLVVLYANVRDERKLPEWIAHHLLLGFDRIIIFDHLSKIPLNLLLKNVFSDKVSIIRVGGTGNIKFRLMRMAVEMSKKMKASWMMYLDADELLCLNYAKNIKQTLNRFYYADQIGINWLMFGSSSYVEQPDGLLMDKFIKSCSLLDKHIKTLVRPSQVKSVTNPHFYNIYNPYRFVCVSNDNKNKNKSLMSNFGAFNDVKMNYKNAIGYIAHYVLQSEETYYRRKNRMQDDGTGIRGELSNFHKLYNDETNLTLKNRYSERIKNYLLENGIIL